MLCLNKHRTKLVAGGDNSFKKADACLWNSAPVSLRDTDLLESFKLGLKRYVYAIINITYKATFWLSVNPLHFNMGTHWQIYFWQSVQLGLTWRFLEASMELATCNGAPRCLVRAWGRLHVFRNNITLKVWLIEWAFI